MNLVNSRQGKNAISFGIPPGLVWASSKRAWFWGI